jgi:hypothetical protein
MERDQSTQAPLGFLGPPHETMGSSRCSIDLWIPATDILVTHAIGFVEWADLRWYTNRADRIISTGQSLYIFHDFEGVTGQDATVRIKLTEWAARRKNFLPGSHFLIGTQIVAMNVSVASLALGRPLKAFVSRTEFEDVLRQMLADRSASGRWEAGGPASLRALPSPTSAREGAGAASAREGAGALSAREGAGALSAREGAGAARSVKRPIR